MARDVRLANNYFEALFQLREIDKVAPTNASVLITGENGPRIHESGLRLRGARITGVLNLAGCDIRHILG